MHRFINKGARGVALLDASGSNKRLKYVFDISDTNGERIPYIWQINNEYTDLVNSYNNKINIIDYEIKRKYEQIDSINNSHIKTEIFNHFNKNKGITELTSSMVCDLVESITVDAERNIILNFKFADELKEYYLYEK